MNTEERLRAALEAHGDALEPAPDGWERIAARLDRHAPLWRRPTLLFPVAAAVTAVLLAAILIGGGDPTHVTTSAPTSAPPTNSEPTTAPPTSAPPATIVEAANPALWPPANGTRFDDPRVAALSFARYFLGMPDPTVAGDGREGEVALRAKNRPAGTITVVEVARDRDGAWVVTGASSDDLQIATPAAEAVVRSPLQITGRSVAFEGTVQMAVLDQGQTLRSGHALGKGMFTGRGDELSPFETTLAFARPSGANGVLVLWTYSAEDGTVAEASVRPVRFTG